MDTAEFIDEATAKHGGRYTYEKSVFTGRSKRIIVTCPAHGDFEPLAFRHLEGRVCIKCAGKVKATKEEFIEKARAIHGDRYDYSKVAYKNNSTNVEIVCPEHGSFFSKPINHYVNKSGCPKCSGVARVTAGEFLASARSIHGDRYDYSKVVFSTNEKQVTIVCTKHGEFFQTPYSHTAGHGCPKCAIERNASKSRHDIVRFIDSANSFHNFKFDYSKSVYINSTSPIEIICPEHGSFFQIPNDHITRYGCVYCAGLAPITKEEFLKRSSIAHGVRYDYSQIEWKGRNESVKIICSKHGEFLQNARSHMDGSGCQKCARESTSSAGEKELADWIEAQDLTIVRNDRTTLDGFEMDIFIPALSIGVEFNGAYWHHDDRLVHPRIHETKALRAAKQGISIITVWDYDWNERKDFIKAMLLHRLGKNTGKKINARSCKVVKIDSHAAGEFFNRTHIQGSAWRALVQFALIEKDKVVACMAFSQGSSRRGKSGSGEWELQRYATDGIVRGGASKLMSAFIVEYSPAAIWSFSDRQSFDGYLYPALGFENDGAIAADYRVHHQPSGKTWHKSAWQRKNIPTRLKELGIDEQYDPATDQRTEREMQAFAGVLRIMDSGKIRWKWTKKHPANRV
jgi:hypothetical protein